MSRKFSEMSNTREEIRDRRSVTLVYYGEIVMERAFHSRNAPKIPLPCPLVPPEATLGNCVGGGN